MDNLQGFSFTNWTMQNMGGISSLQGMEFTEWPENTTIVPSMENMQGCPNMDNIQGIEFTSMENMQGCRDWTMERNGSVHSMATTSICEYLAAKKREQRTKEK